MKTNSILSLAAFAAMLLPAQAIAGEQIRVVGSSTVYPFVTVAAEEFGNRTEFKTPIIEATGTGGGIKLFCAGVGGEFPDIVNASRAIKSTEREMCAKNGVDGITEVKIGFDGIVLANSKEEKHYNLTKHQIFLALAKKVPSNGKLIDNPNKKWSDIDPSLPDVKIEVYGPPSTSGTRDAFVELVMEKACKDLPEFKAAYPDKKERKKACHILREDGHYVEAGENDNLIVQKLRSNPRSLGIFGYSFLDQNKDTVQGSTIYGVDPTFENISDGSYGISRSLFVYFKDAHIGLTKGLGQFAQELLSEEAAGEYGYLADKGMIPLSEEELIEMERRVEELGK